MLQSKKKQFSDSVDIYDPKEKRNALLKKSFLFGLPIIAIIALFLLFRGEGFPTGEVISGLNSSSGYKDAQSFQTAQSQSSRLIEYIILLRKASIQEDVVKTAFYITKIEKLIKEMQSQEIVPAWQKAINCAYNSCDDKVFLELIDIAAISELDKGRNSIIHSLIRSASLWDGQNIVLFSESLTQTDKQIEEINSQSVSETWSKTISCNGRCSEFNDLVIDLIEKLNN